MIGLSPLCFVKITLKLFPRGMAVKKYHMCEIDKQDMDLFSYVIDVSGDNKDTVSVSKT